MAAVLNVWRRIENPTPSVDTYLLEEHSCQISSRSDLKRQSLGLRRSSQHEEEEPDVQRYETCSEALRNHSGPCHFLRPGPPQIQNSLFSFCRAPCQCRSQSLDAAATTSLRHCFWFKEVIITKRTKYARVIKFTMPAMLETLLKMADNVVVNRNVRHWPEIVRVDAGSMPWYGCLLRVTTARQDGLCLERHVNDDC